MALELSEDLLADIELTRLSPTAIVKKASRLARLLDDLEAQAWLSFEMSGFKDSETGNITREASLAAARSGRTFYDDEDSAGKLWTQSLGHLQATVEAAKVQLAAAADAPVSITSANPSQFVGAPAGNARERSSLTLIISRDEGLIENIMGAVHAYVSERNLELRFGAAVETAFGLVRSKVDAQIADLVPEAAVKLSAAFENAASDNSEDWASAAATCRRLIKAVADALRPPGGDVDGRKMGDAQYVNRLVDWIVHSSEAGGTVREVVIRDLEYLGNRLDALGDGGHKGAHAEVTRYEASRFITGTYLLIGDILQLRPSAPPVGATDEDLSAVDSLGSVPPDEGAL